MPNSPRPKGLSIKEDIYSTKYIKVSADHFLLRLKTHIIANIDILTDISKKIIYK